MLKYIVALMALTTLTFAAEGQHNRLFDVDGDKALNKTEWVARAAARFNLLDTNKDGKVTCEEVKEGRKGRREHHKDRKHKE
jgi:hypothetical protein